MIESWAKWLNETPMAIYIQEDVNAFPMLEVLHVVFIALVVGSIFIVDLRLLNLSARSYPVSRLMRAVLPITIISFIFAAVSGFLMFASQATRYLATPIFVIKMGLLSLAVVNMIFFHFVTHRGIANWDTSETVPNSAKLAGLASLLLWVGILVAGRFVGFLLSY
jgi:small-conductance mechanosensitive channel